MEIKGSNITKAPGIKFKPAGAKQQSSVSDKSLSKGVLSKTPAFSAPIQTDINLPVSFVKTGEIQIPGLKENASIYKLANGQTVIAAVKNGPAVVKTSYNTGSMNEPDNIRGMSHFIEHNLFNGSKNLKPKEYDAIVSSLGGETNASTGFAVTDYYLKLQPLEDSSIEHAIKLNAEQTQYPLFPENQLIKEKEPVKSEIDRCSDNPETSAVCTALKNLFKIKTSSPDFVIGTKENINSFTRSMVLDYFNTWYTPDNAVTVITGCINPDETARLAAKYFNKKNDYSHVHKRYWETISYIDKPVREDIVRPNTEQPFAIAAFAVPEGTPYSDLDKIDVLSSVLMSKNSSLYKALDSIHASINISSENMQNKPKGAKAVILTIYAPEEHIEEALKIVYSEITKLSSSPAGSENVFNAKKKIINELLSASESSSELNSILTNAALSNRIDYFNSKIGSVQNITPADILETARKYFDLNKVSLCVMHKKDTDKETIKNNYKAGAQISFGAGKSLLERIRQENDAIAQFQLANNIETTVITGSPYAKSYIVLGFVSDELNSVTSPAFSVLNEMLNRGSLVKGADEYNKILDEKDIKVFFAAETNGLAGAAKCGGENLLETLELMKEKLLNPNFSEKEFIRAKQIVKHAVSSETISAFDKIEQEFFSETAKYKDKETRLKELEQITLKDIQQLYSKIINTSRTYAVMTSDAAGNYAALFNNSLSELPFKFKPFSSERGSGYKIYKPYEKGRILTAQREQAQAEVVQGYKFKISKNISDTAKINILNLILGAGGMSSRLFLDLREDKKLAYSTGSKLLEEKDTGALCLRIETTTQSTGENEGSPDNINKALEGFNRNVNLLKTQNVSDKELNDAKAKYKTAVLNKFETNAGKTEHFSDIKNSCYGLEYCEKLIEAIDKITPDDIRAAANYVFKNPPVISIAAGRETLESLKLSR